MMMTNIFKLLILACLAVVLVTATSSDNSSSSSDVGDVDSSDDGPMASFYDRKPCQKGKLRKCVRLIIAEMDQRLEQLGCDHNAIFALTYLRTTETFLATARTLPYQDVGSVVREDALFADYYFNAFDAYVALQNGGDDSDSSEYYVPPAWQIAFDAATDLAMTSIGNALLGISAHINNDLPLVLFELYKDGNPVSEFDHFLVNEFLAQVSFDDELIQCFDPLYPPTEPTPADGGEPNLVEVWRSLAWTNYQSLVAAYEQGDDAGVQAIIQTIETTAAAFGQQFLATLALPDGLDSAARDAFCQAQQESEVCNGH